MSNVENTLIIDVGTSSIKAGVSSESLPAVVFPTVVGTPKRNTGLLKKKTIGNEEALPSTLIGHEALHHMHRCALNYPVERGVVSNWASMEHIINHCFTELDVEPSSTGVVMTEPPYNPRQCTERLAETFFEAFGSPQLAVIPSGICALYASGRTTGVVLDSGAGVTHVTPVFESFIVQNAINRINFGGNDVTQHLRTLLFERGLNFTSPQDELEVKRMKEALCTVSQDYASDLSNQEEILADYFLPDGQNIQIGRERFRAPEILFSPNIVQSEMPSLQEFVAGAVKACGIDVRKSLMGNIVLCGGNTLYGGFAKRLEDEATKFFPGLFGSVKVIDSSDRLFSVWAGACVVANLPSFSSNIVTRSVYEEHGASIVRGYSKGQSDHGEAPSDDA